MRVIRKQYEHGERSDKEEAVSNSSWKELSKVLDDCNIQEERLDEANGSVVFISQAWGGHVYICQRNNTRMLISSQI